MTSQGQSATIYRRAYSIFTRHSCTGRYCCGAY